MDEGYNEQALLIRYRRTRDADAWNDLVLAQYAWIARVAAQYHAPNWEHSDLTHTGMEALMRYLPRHDAERVPYVRLRTAAEPWVRDGIRRAIEPDIAEQPTMPLDALTGYHAPSWLLDRETRELPAIQESVEEQVIARVDGVSVQHLSALLTQALLLLPAREYDVITRRYGLTADGGVWSQAAIARQIGRCERTVRRIQTSALRHLRLVLDEARDTTGAQRAHRDLDDLQRSARHRLRAPSGRAA